MIGQHHKSQISSALSEPRRLLMIWFAVTGILATLAIAIFGNAAELISQSHGLWGWMKFTAIGATGVIALLAAIKLNSGRSSRIWLWLPVPMLLTWIGSCIADGRGRVTSRVPAIEWSLLTGLNSAIFILAGSILLVVSLTKLMRRSPRHWPLSTTLYIGLGAAAISVFVMQFFQLHTPNIIDFILRITAILVVVGATALFAQLCPTDG
jgi:hypothetical protein